MVILHTSCAIFPNPIKPIVWPLSPLHLEKASLHHQPSRNNSTPSSIRLFAAIIKPRVSSATALEVLPLHAATYIPY